VLGVASAAVTLLSLLATGAMPVSAASITGAVHGKSGMHSKKVCAKTPAGHVGCHARVVTDADLRPLATTLYQSGYSPTQLRAAYGLTNDATTTVAIVDAYANPNAASDLAAYRAQFGGTGKLTQVNQTGGSISTVSGNVSWGVEEMLDLEMVSAICPSCSILYVGANSAAFNDLGLAVNMAATLGATVISNSYGASEFSTEADFAGYYNHPGVAITVSSGDSGYGVGVPAAFNTVTAVGGTTLKLNADNTRLSETVWRGAGSGCSKYIIPKPGWQHDPACTRRTVADVAAVADPATGVAVYSSYGNTSGANWSVYGGTSVSAPIIGAVYALSGRTGAGVDPASSLAYIALPGSLFDVTSGTNGRCVFNRKSNAAYLCTGMTGYDGPTGNGTPNGTSAF